MRSLRLLLPSLALLAGCASSDGAAVDLPDGEPGIGFDDLRYSAKLHRVLVPAGRTGRLDMIDPDTLEVTSIEGFSKVDDYSGGHDDGPTSVDEGKGFLFVTDRTAGKVYVADPKSRTIVGSRDLAGHPDYVRFVEATSEIWITEPDGDMIEVFTVGDDGQLGVAPTSTIPVSGGPESLVIDQSHGRAYTHEWHGKVVVIDVRKHAEIARWPNGCAASRGLALDEARQLFFTSCGEGTVTAIDARDGRMLSSIAAGSGFDVMGYDPSRGHLYLAGFGGCSCTVMLGTDPKGGLHFLDRYDAPLKTHCAAADDRGHAWVCDPDEGRVLRVDDGHAPSW